MHSNLKPSMKPCLCCQKQFLKSAFEVWFCAVRIDRVETQWTSPSNPRLSLNRISWSCHCRPSTCRYVDMQGLANKESAFKVTQALSVLLSFLILFKFFARHPRLVLLCARLNLQLRTLWLECRVCWSIPWAKLLRTLVPSL